MNDTIADGPRSLARTESTLRNALLDSRQRWRDLVTMGADLAYETDAWGRFVFVIPDPSLGWSTATLIGQPAELLLVGGTNANGFNPFRVTAPVRRRRAWLNRTDGSATMLVFSAAPLFDAEAHIVGTRGIGVDWTSDDEHEAGWRWHCVAVRCWIMFCGAWATRCWRHV